MAIGQKEAVINEVLVHLPAFNKGVDNALQMLTSHQLEVIKGTIYGSILTGVIQYSKNLGNIAEVRSYARSMVMNHLKKAKELNGGNVYISPGSGSTSHSRASSIVSPSVHRNNSGKVKPVGPKGVDLDLLPDDLRDYVKSLV